MTNHTLGIIIQEGEGQRIEFKENLAHLDRELVAFANSSGGSVFVGVADNGSIVGVKDSNTIRSQIQDIARNCDPAIKIRLHSHGKQVIEVLVEEGIDKPHRCRDGFFLRNGPNTQKLSRNEIRSIIVNEPHGYYDDRWNTRFTFPGDFSEEKLSAFLEHAGISIIKKAEIILKNLDCACEKNGRLVFNNAGILFFARNPQQFFRESYITCVRYQGAERFEILDRQDIYGNPIECIEGAIRFIQRNIHRAEIVGEDLRHATAYEYPIPALREAVINAVTHRDYFYDASHIYIHIFSDRLEIENPGGLPFGLSIKDLGERSVRRNRLIADLLYRTGYIERIGSGIQRMRKALLENGNPDFEVTATNFFVLRFRPQIERHDSTPLSKRQALLVQALAKAGSLNKSRAAAILGISNDTALRELNGLLERGLITRKGSGRGTWYERVER